MGPRSLPPCRQGSISGRCWLRVSPADPLRSGAPRLLRLDAPPNPSRLGPTLRQCRAAPIPNVSSRPSGLAFAIGTGLRQGELLGLRWEDVDLDARTLRVSAQLDRRGGLTEVKTEGGRRSLGLPDLAVYALKAQRANQARQRLAAGSSWRVEDYVFTGAKGKARDWRSLDRCFVRAQERAGVRRQRFRDMRHAFATLLLDAGEEIAVISKMLGHADYSTTVDVYSHLSTERSRVAAARIDGLLKRREISEETA